MEFIEKVMLPTGTEVSFWGLSKTYGANSKAPGQQIVVATAMLPDGRVLEGIMSSKLVAEKGMNTWEAFIPMLKASGRNLFWGKLKFDDDATLELFFANSQRQALGAIKL